MSQYLYLASLLVSLLGIGILDYKYKVAFFYDRTATIKTVLVGLLFFLAWDAAGIIAGIFFTGGSIYDLGILLAPELPLEEPVFLIFLCYITLVLWRGMERIWQRT